MAIAVVLLAAGASRRMGQPKQLAAFQGTTLLRHAASIACSVDEVTRVVVLGAHAPRLEKELEGLPVTVVVNGDWEEGIASSIRCGVMALPNDIEAAVIMLCDQPQVTSEHIDNLVTAYRKTGDPVVASMYQGSMGVPAVFDRTLFPELLSLAGDMGAKLIILEHAEESMALPFPPAAYDVDTLDDLETIE